MSVKAQYLYYSIQDRIWFDPFNANLPVTMLDLYKRDSIMLRVQAVTSTSGLTINSDYTAPNAFCTDYSDLVNFTFGIKTRANYASEGPFTQAFTTFATGDYFYVPAKSRFAIPVGIVGGVTAGNYLSEFHFYTVANAVNTFGRFPLACPITQDLVTGQEPNPTPPPSNIGSATILAGNDSVLVTYSTMTATGIIFASWLGNPVSTLGAIAGTGNFTIKSGGPVSADTNVAYNIASIS